MHPQHARMSWWRELSTVNQGELQWLPLAPDEEERGKQIHLEMLSSYLVIKSKWPLEQNLDCTLS